MAIKIKFRDCCHRCNHIEPYTDGDTLYNMNRIEHREVGVGCKHEKVCKEYIEEEERDNVKSES